MCSTAGLIPGLFELRSDYREYIENSEEPALKYKIMNWMMAGDRSPGPADIHELSVSAKRRWLEKPENLKDGAAYRPATLEKLAPALHALDAEQYRLGSHAAQAGRLPPIQSAARRRPPKIAKELCGNVNQSNFIFKANLDKLDDPNRIYPGMILRSPK